MELRKLVATFRLTACCEQATERRMVGCKLLKSRVVWFYSIYLGFKSYQGEWVEVPVISDFVRNQGWA